MFFSKRLWRRYLAAAIALLQVPFSLAAQKTNTIPDSVLLKTVVIQATRAGARSPVPHSDLNAGQIEKSYQVQDVPYLLSGIPALVETSDAGAGVGYTGMRIRGSDPTRINITINGIPFNDAESQGVYWVDLPDIAASASEIQVQRGVGTSTNGTGAFGATVNLDLSRINPEPFANLTNSLGSFGTRKHSLNLETGLLGGKIALSSRLSQIESGGYVDRAFTHLRSYHLSAAYVDDRQSVQAHILSGYERTYQAWNGLPAQLLETDSLRTFNSAGTEKAGAPYPNEVDDYTQRHYLLHYRRLLSPNLTLQLNGHFTRGYGYYEQYKAAQDYTGYGLPEPVIGDTTLQSTDLVRQRWLDNYFYGSTFALRWTPEINPPALSAAPEFMVGGAISRYEGAHHGDVIWAQNAIPKDFRYYDNRADKLDFNLFGKMECFFRNGLSALLDLQYRRISYTFLGFDDLQNNVTQTSELHFFNPKAGINWQFKSNWTAYAFFGVGQREPNRDDYTQSSPASRPKPEKLYDWEWGLKQRSETWLGTLNFFYMDYRDQLVLDGRINDVGAYIRTNVPRSYRAGLELETAFRLHPRLWVRANTCLSRNLVREFNEYRDNWDHGGQEVFHYRNTDLAFSPALTARGEIAWTVLELKRQVLAVSLSGKYVGKQFLDNTSNNATMLPAYFFSDFRLNYDVLEWVGKRVRLVFALNNILDARYVSNGWVYRYISMGYDDRPFNRYTKLEGDGVYHQAGYFPQAGRNVMATLIFEF